MFTKRSAILILFLFCYNSLLHAQIQVLESDGSHIKISWNIEKIDTLTVYQNNKINVALSFFGQNTIIGEDGEAAIPGYSLFAGLPPVGNVSVSVIPEEIITVKMSGAPIKQISNKFDFTRQPGLKFSNPWISDTRYLQLKNIRTANVIIRPVLYDKNTGILRILTKGIISISIPEYPRTPKESKSDFDKMLSSLICNYEIAKGWQVDAKNLGKVRSSISHPLENKKVYHFRIGDGHNGFNEGTINENGLMKIPGSSILSTFGTTAIKQVRLFASFKGELPVSVPAPDSIPEGVGEVPLLRIDNNFDGLVDNDDYFIAYVTGASDWFFDGKEYEMKIDRYDDYRNYWLMVGGNGKSITSYVNNDNSEYTYDVFQEQLCLKKSIKKKEKSEGSPNWAWSSLTPSNTKFVHQLSLPRLDTSISGTLTVKCKVGYGTLRGSFGDLIGTSIYSNRTYPLKNWNINNLTFNFEWEDSKESFADIENITLRYSRKIELNDTGNLTIFSKTDDGVFSYKFNGTNDTVYIFRIDNNERDVSLIEKTKIDNGKAFRWTDSGGIGARYLICKESALLPLPANEEYKSTGSSPHIVHDLRNSANKSDFLIITHKDFISEAESLAVHKEKVGFTRPVMIDINDIYKWFSGGDLDPASIRNFLSYVYSYWRDGKNLDYVVMMGTGHYDVKNFKAGKPAFIPSFYHDELLYDDFFSVIQTYGYNATPSFSLGRIPCETKEDAIAVVRKIREYEDPVIADYSEWRNRALFVADDDMQGNKEDGIPHYLGSDKASDSLSNSWKSIDIRKVFLFEYEWDISGKKPGATSAIINEINNGVSFVNYFGHGAAKGWADEYILIADNLDQMSNRKKYPIILSFSCSVGRFDLPEEVCLSEALVNANRRGAITTISSSRSSGAGTNEQLAENFFSSLSDTSGNIASAGMMLTLAKIKSSSDGNRTYVFLGDPSLKFVKSSKKITLDIFDKDNIAITSMKALQQIKIKGCVTKNDGTPDNDYGSVSKPAYAHIGIFNPDYTTTRKDGGERMAKYQLPGSPVFLGKTIVNGGHFEQTITLPRSLVFDKNGVKMIAYSWCDGIGEGGSGLRNDLIFNGSEKLSLDDTIGPSITIRPIYDSENMSHTSASFSDQITSSLPLNCELDIYDQSGIDVVGTGPDEGLTMEIQGSLSKRNINHKFQFKDGDSRTGIATLEFDEKSLKNGKHTLNITARDLLGYISIKTFTIEIIDEQDLALDHVLNFPNPFRIGHTTRFYFYPSNTAQQWTNDRIRVVVKIYTLSGKLVRVMKDAPNGVVWDGKDQRGVTLSPDVYLYQVNAYSSQKKKLVKSKVNKLVIYPPR